MTSQRDASRKDYSLFGAQARIDEINSGSLQRIADAIEKMAESYDAVRNDRDLYKRRYEENRARCARLQRQVSALRGHITRLKRRGAA